MGFFNSIKSNWKQYEAVVVLSELLEDQVTHGNFTSDPRQTAKLLISKIWSERPDIFNGKFGQRPHKLTVSAMSLAYALESLSPENINFIGLRIVLANLLEEWRNNGSSYPLNTLDNKLLKAAGQILIQLSNRTNETSNNNSKPKTEKNNNFNYSNFEDWMLEYKKAAANVNEALKPTDGLYLIDIMEDKPLRRAFNDKVDPQKLGTHFGENFDILKMGTK